MLRQKAVARLAFGQGPLTGTQRLFRGLSLGNVAHGRNVPVRLSLFVADRTELCLDRDVGAVPAAQTVREGCQLRPPARHVVQDPVERLGVIGMNEMAGPRADQLLGVIAENLPRRRGYVCASRILI